jgi:hypothetical protein
MMFSLNPDPDKRPPVNGKSDVVSETWAIFEPVCLLPFAALVIIRVFGQSIIRSIRILACGLTLFVKIC